MLFKREPAYYLGTLKSVIYDPSTGSNRQKGTKLHLSKAVQGHNFTLDQINSHQNM